MNEKNLTPEQNPAGAHNPIGSEPNAAPGSELEDKRWYVVQAHSGYEKQVEKSMREHIMQNDMQDEFGEIMVPIEEVVEMRDGQKRVSERKIFPGYILVHMKMSDAAWHLVKNVPKVSGFIGGTEHLPTPISDAEAEKIIQQVTDSADKPKMKVTFSPGELVRVIDGPFADHNGTVEDVNFEKAKMRVSIMLFGRSTSVELDFAHVAKG